MAYLGGYTVLFSSNGYVSVENSTFIFEKLLSNNHFKCKIWPLQSVNSILITTPETLISMNF